MDLSYIFYKTIYICVYYYKYKTLPSYGGYHYSYPKYKKLESDDIYDVFFYFFLYVLYFSNLIVYLDFYSFNYIFFIYLFFPFHFSGFRKNPTVENRRRMCIMMAINLFLMTYILPYI